jgi:hypothetical protein
MIVRDYQRSITPMSVWFELATCGHSSPGRLR